MRQDETSSRRGRGKKSHKLDAFIGAMLTHPTVESAAEAAGISHATAHRWLKDPIVIERLAQAHRDAWNQTIACLQEVGPEAVQTLRRNMAEADSGSVQVSAARAALEMSFRAVEAASVEQRLSALEEAVKSRKGGAYDHPNITPAGAVGKADGHGQ
jgi:hypothetical protein